MERRYDILGVGDADVDFMVRVKDFPEAGQKSSGQLVGRYPGGMVANFLAAASTFGAACAGVLCVGDDPFGEETLADLESRGVSVEGSIRRAGESTYFTTTCLGSDGEKRMILCFGGAIYPEAGEVEDSALASARYVQMTGGHVSLTIPIARRARSLGTKVSLDLERMQSHMSPEDRDTLLSLADIVFPNEDGLRSYSGCTDIAEGARALLDKGPEIVVVTKGADGSEVFTRDSHISVPAFPVEVLDTTGAGDTYNGVFLSALCKGHPLEDCALLAGAAAAIQITAVGSRTALASEEQIRAFLRERQVSLRTP